MRCGPVTCAGRDSCGNLRSLYSFFSQGPLPHRPVDRKSRSSLQAPAPSSDSWIWRSFLPSVSPVLRRFTTGRAVPPRRLPRFLYNLWENPGLPSSLVLSSCMLPEFCLWPIVTHSASPRESPSKDRGTFFFFYSISSASRSSGFRTRKDIPNTPAETELLGGPSRRALSPLSAGFSLLRCGLLVRSGPPFGRRSAARRGHVAFSLPFSAGPQVDRGFLPKTVRNHILHLQKDPGDHAFPAPPSLHFAPDVPSVRLSFAKMPRLCLFIVLADVSLHLLEAEMD